MATPYALPDLVYGRLESLISDARVRHIANLAAIADESQPAPAIYVIPARLSINDDSIDQIPIWRESVMVAVATRYVNQVGGEGARQLAGPLLSAVIAGLAGWQPALDYTPLIFETPIEQQYVLGFGYYPLQLFTCYEV